MDYTEIDDRATIQDAIFAPEDEWLENRPILLTGFAAVNRSEYLVPVDPDDRESMTLALTQKQGEDALRELACQIGRETAFALVQSLEV
jgi:hypothetical protein